jgi:hypothetical protein
MGLLDDAIREHLDLKRRRGADPTEIERAEREALGPVRRGPEITGDEPAPPESDPELEAGYPESDAAPPDPEAGHPALDSEPWEPFQEDPELRAPEDREELTPYEPSRAPDGDPLMEDEPLSGEATGTVHSEPDDLAPPPEAESLPAPYPAEPPAAPAHPQEPSAPVDRETEEYELEPEDAADDDVLESTPEFLQDAPEHDRLWFEQRPPRDFDFDG